MNAVNRGRTTAPAARQGDRNSRMIRVLNSVSKTKEKSRDQSLLTIKVRSFSEKGG